MSKEARQGKYGLWYVEGSTAGHATKEAAEASLLEIKQATRSTETQPEDAALGRLAVKWVIGLAVLAGGAYWWHSGAELRALKAEQKAAAAVDRKERMDALLTCQKAIQATARYGGAETPPYVDAKRGTDVIQFVWPEGSFHFKNGFGASVPQWARCQVSPSSGRIIYLVVTGTAVVGPP